MISKTKGRTAMEQGPIYVAGGLYGDPATFQLVRAGHGNDRPYLTKRPNGLRLTAHHANLYALKTDLSEAVLSDYRQGPGRALRVKLTEEQKNMIRKSIETNYFFQ